MIEHREDATQPRRPRRYRPTLAKTLCSRWVDVVRLAGSDRPTTCSVCRSREGQAG